MNKNFLQSKSGKYLIILICYIVIYGFMAVLHRYGLEYGQLIVLAGIYFGWKGLSKIQPAMFIWMPIVGWLIYLLVKLFLSACIGIFILPYVLGDKIWRFCCNE